MAEIESILQPILILIIIGFFGIHVIIMGQHLAQDWRSLRSWHHEQIQSIFTMIITTILIVAVFTWIILTDNRIFADPDMAGLFFLMFGGFPLLMAAILLLTNLIQYLRGVTKPARVEKQGDTIDSKKRARRLDFIRKIFHLLTFVLLATILLGLAKFLRTEWAMVWDSDWYWGQIDGSTILIQLGSTNETFSIGQMFIFGMFYGTVCVTLMFESCRLSDHVQFPLVEYVEKTLRKKEFNTYASHTHIALGYLLASLVMPPNCLIASLCLFSTGDTMAAIVGINFGKHRYQYNGKSWEGTITGVVLSLVSTYFFVGWVWAIVCAVIFLVIDLLTPTIVKISDNLLLPLVSIIIFFLLNLAEINATFPIGYLLGVD